MTVHMMIASSSCRENGAGETKASDEACSLHTVAHQVTPGLEGTVGRSWIINWKIVKLSGGEIAWSVVGRFWANTRRLACSSLVTTCDRIGRHSRNVVGEEEKEFLDRFPPADPRRAHRYGDESADHADGSAHCLSFLEA